MKQRHLQIYCDWLEMSEQDFSTKYPELESAIFLKNNFLFVLRNDFRTLSRENFYAKYSEDQRAIAVVKFINELKNMEAQARQNTRNWVKTNRQLLIKLLKVKCIVCGLNLPDLLEIHHKISLENGGDNSISNLALLCCNCHNLTHSLAQSSGDQTESILKWVEENLPSKQEKILISLWLTLKKSI